MLASCITIGISMRENDYKYRDMVGRLAKIISAELLKLEAIYNFDLGDEFEIALCKILSQALPDKYGVCRGHVVTEDNQTAGDDIIIYDRDGSPTLRMLPNGDFSIKEYIPFDSVYAYIEAKHTLYWDGNSSQSVVNAASQVSAVKSLYRETRSHYKITDNLTLKPGILTIDIGGLEHPEITNPLVGCIFSRYVNWNGKRRSFNELKDPPIVNFGLDMKLQPEIIVAGNDMVGLPAKEEGGQTNLYLFRGTKESTIKLYKTEGRALAIGIISMLHAIDAIRLNKLKWAPIIAEQLNYRKG